MDIKDSGTRREFNSGAVRDAETGKGRFDLITPIALTRLAQHYEGGAIKYDARNWEKGIPLSTFMDSALRHLNKYREGLREEDHMAAALWNVAGFIHTEEVIKRGLLSKELDDLPSYVEQPNSDYNFVYKTSTVKNPRFGIGDRIVLPDGRVFYYVKWGNTYSFVKEDISEWIEDLPSLEQLNDGNEQKMRDMFARPPSLKPHTAYFSHHIRGVKGKDATDKEQDANREDAIKVCNQLRELLPDWKIYCPAEVDEVISELFKSGAIGEKEILDADCKILERRDVLFTYCKDGHISRGMRIELDHATKISKPVIMFEVLDEYAKQNILQSTDYLKGK